MTYTLHDVTKGTPPASEYRDITPKDLAQEKRDKALTIGPGIILTTGTIIGIVLLTAVYSDLKFFAIPLGVFGGISGIALSAIGIFLNYEKGRRESIDNLYYAVYLMTQAELQEVYKHYDGARYWERYSLTMLVREGVLLPEESDRLRPILNQYDNSQGWEAYCAQKGTNFVNAMTKNSNSILSKARIEAQQTREAWNKLRGDIAISLQPKGSDSATQ